MGQWYREYDYLDDGGDKSQLSCKRLECLVKDTGVLEFEGEVGNYIKGLVIKSLNEGAFSRYSVSKEDNLYWLPGGNAGVPVMNRSSKMHESKFLIHDVLHQLMPDMIVDTFDPGYKHIYVVSRMISETITMVLADYLYLDCLKGLDDELDLDIMDRKIYRTFYNEYGDDLTEYGLDMVEDILFNHTLYGISGDYDYKEYHRNFDEWCNNVFVADFKWTVSNYSKIKSLGRDYILWAKGVKATVGCGSRFRFLSDYEYLVGEDITTVIEELFNESIELYYSDVEYELTSLENREAKAKNLISLYNLDIDGVSVIDVEDCSLGVDRVVKHFNPYAVSYAPKLNSRVEDNIDKFKRSYNNKVCVFPASFDVVHYGHLNIIEELSYMYDEVDVLVVINRDKNHMFSLEERVEILRELTVDYENVNIVGIEGRATDYMRDNYIRDIARGVRNYDDYTDEVDSYNTRLTSLWDVNHILLFGDKNYHNYSSSKVKELLKLGENVDRYIPEYMQKVLKSYAE